MQIAPLIRSTLHLAGYLAGRGCIALAHGQPAGVDLGRVREDGSLQLEAHAALHEGALAQGRALLAAPAAGIAAQVLVQVAQMTLDDTPFAQALLAECADATGSLAGVVVAMPFRPLQPGQPMAMHAVRLRACPEALRPLGDELLQAFSQGLASLPQGLAAWMQALEPESPVPPRAPADLRDPQVLACAIHAADPQPDSDAKAAAHLQAYADHATFEGGLGFEKALRALSLDFSPASLAQVDALLDRLHAERRPRPDAFLGAQAGLNFLHLVAIYLGETMAQAAGATICWRTHAQLESVDPGRLDGEADSATALVCVFNGHGPGTGLVFMPLDVVTCRLFGQPDAPTLAAVAEAALPAIRAARRVDVIDPASGWTPARGEFTLPRPPWVDGDPLARWFDDLPALWRTGRVVWGRLVQANAQLFRPGPDDHPGEVIYDADGRLDPEGLDAAADRVYALKGLRPRSPSLAYLATYLAHAAARVRGFPVPASLGARGLRVSTLVFHRAHLPGGRLAGLLFPIVVSDVVPGVVAVLPAPLWPRELRAGWLA